MNDETLIERLDRLASYLLKEASVLRVQAKDENGNPLARQSDLGTATGFELSAKWIREELALESVTK